MEPLQLKPDELERAHAIRSAISQSDKVHSISDLECAQWSITTMGKTIPEVLENIWRMQCFLEQYRLDGASFEEGMELIRSSFEKHPGLLLGVDYLSDKNHFLMVVDYAAFYPGRVRLESDWKVFSGGLYYMYMAMSCNLTVIREGISIMMECEGVQVLNVDVQVEERFIFEFFAYPMKVREIFCTNPPGIVAMLYGALKRFIPQEQREVIWMGSIPGYEGGRMDHLYNVPTPEIAQTLLLQRIELFLKQRLENQEEYTLPPRSVVEAL